MEIIFKKTAELKPYKKNPRINDKAVEATKKSILLHGFINPLIIGKDDVIIAGHTRLKAAKQMDLQELPCIVMDEEDPDLIRQYRIVDNKTAEKSSWNIPKLIEELSGLSPEERKSYRIADNRTGEFSSWDGDLLEAEMREIKADDWQKFGFKETEIRKIKPNDLCKCPRCGQTFVKV